MFCYVFNLHATVTLRPRSVVSLAMSSIGHINHPSTIQSLEQCHSEGHGTAVPAVLPNRHLKREQVCDLLTRLMHFQARVRVPSKIDLVSSQNEQLGAPIKHLWEH